MTENTMKIPKADYTTIATKYDLGWKGRGRDADLDLAEIGEEKTPVFALDVGCGTGNYIAGQMKNQSCLVEWTGADPSEDMLAFAVDKVKAPRWVNCPAEDLPLSSEHFDYIYSSFAYHHFEDRGRAFDEMVRVLKPDGTIKLHNICPEYMRDCAVYRYFETTREIDKGRHPSMHRLIDDFKRRGFEVDARLSIVYSKKLKHEYIEGAERRDNSMLAILDDDLYDDGLQRLYDLEDPEVVDETAFLTVKAKRNQDI
jgi:ubiquinone/menaquinone biosynthesis C-methylase UbiE